MVLFYCCEGVSPIYVWQTICSSSLSSKCYSDTITGATYYGCAGDSTTLTSAAKTCTTDFCNCPAEAHKSPGSMPWFYREMRKIMYPIMGIIFSLLWVGLAFIGGGPIDIVLLVVAIIDAVLGILLIFLPETTYLGLFYVAIGALTIAVVRHSLGGNAGLIFLIVLTIGIFLLTGGLTVVANSNNYFDRVAAYFTFCQRDMNIINWDNLYWNLDTRCENFSLFVAFCVFLLFLVQPVALLELFFKKSGGHGGGLGGNAGHAGHAGHGGHGGHGSHEGHGHGDGHGAAPANTVISTSTTNPT